MSNAPALTKLLTVGELAEATGLKERYIRQRCTDRRIPCYCIDGMYRFDLAEIQEWLKGFYRPDKTRPEPAQAEAQS